MEHPPPGTPSPLPGALRAWYVMLSYGASIWVTSRAAVAKRVVPSDTCQAGTKSTRQGGGAGPEVYATNCTVNRTTRLRTPSPIRDSGAILPGRMDTPKNLIAETCVVGRIVALAVVRPRAHSNMRWWCESYLRRCTAVSVVLSVARAGLGSEGSNRSAGLVR